MLEKVLRNRINDARKNNNKTEKEILGLVLGEIQTIEARNGNISEEEKINIIKKMIKSNGIMLQALVSNEEEKARLLDENKILEEFIPKGMSLEEIEKFIKDNEIVGSGNALIGMVMKKAKEKGLSIDGKDVKRYLENLG